MSAAETVATTTAEAVVNWPTWGPPAIVVGVAVLLLIVAAGWSGRRPRDVDPRDDEQPELLAHGRAVQQRIKVFDTVRWPEAPDDTRREDQR